jgi:hypothetical protein
MSSLQIFLHLNQPPPIPTAGLYLQKPSFLLRLAPVRSWVKMIRKRLASRRDKRSKSSDQKVGNYRLSLIAILLRIQIFHIPFQEAVVLFPQICDKSQRTSKRWTYAWRSNCRTVLSGIRCTLPCRRSLSSHKGSVLENLCRLPVRKQQTSTSPCPKPSPF